MAEYSRPWDGTVLGDAGPYTADQWWEMYRSIFVDSSRWDTEGPIAGILKELRVIATTPPSMSVIVEPGAALVYGGWYLLDANQAFSISLNPAPNPARTDAIILRADWATQTIRLVRLEGSTTLTQVAGTTWDIPLAHISVPQDVLRIREPNGSLLATDGLITDVRELVGERRRLLGIGDFETDLAMYVATLVAFGATDNRAWHLEPGDRIYASVVVPAEWGDSPLDVTVYLWVHGAAIETYEFSVWARALSPAQTVANYQWISDISIGAANQVRRVSADSVGTKNRLVVTPGQELNIRVETSYLNVNDYEVLGMELYFRRV